MQNSNWTLRFPRTSREAFGYSIQPEQHQGNKWAGIAAVFAVGLLTAVLCAVFEMTLIFNSLLVIENYTL